MNNHMKLFGSLLVLTSALFTVRSAAGQAGTLKVPVTTVVTVLGPNFTAPPALGKTDVIVRVKDHREDVIGWDSAQGEKSALELAIVIDDLTNIGNQMDDLRKFIHSQSKATSVGLFYANNGVTQAVAPFSTDHDEVASNPDSPDVSATIDKAQKAGIMIHTLYARGGGREGRNLFRVNYGQSNLAQMADGTGGEAFFQGLETPISFTPYLEQLDMVLHNQYILTFTTPRSLKKNGELRGFKVSTEQHNVEISAARYVWVPGR
jgi:hypothetical protein